MNLKVEKTKDYLEFNTELSNFDFEELVDNLSGLDLYPYSTDWDYIYIIDTQNYMVYEGETKGNKFERCLDDVANEILEEAGISGVHWVWNYCIIFSDVGIIVVDDNDNVVKLSWKDIVNYSKEV